MGTNSIPNKNTALALNQSVIEGVDKHFAKVKTLTLAGASYTPTTLKALLQAEIDGIKSIDVGRAQVKEQVATHRETQAKAYEARAALRAYILGTAGAKAVGMLQDFGMSAPKPKGRKTVAVKAEAITKSLATREARHTMGKNQKKPITGEHPQVEPKAQAETPAPTATPAATVTPKQ